MKKIIENSEPINTIWPTLPPRFRSVILEYEKRASTENAILERLSHHELSLRRDEFLVCVGRDTGFYLNSIVRDSQSRAILELGTGFGYSTLWLAEAARRHGGTVLSVDLVAEKQRVAGAALRKADLADCVEFVCGDAVEFLRGTAAQFDFVLLDSWKDSYTACIDQLLPRLLPDAILVADNMSRPQSVRFAALRYQSHLRQLMCFSTTLLEIGSGIAVSKYKGEL